MRRPEVLLLATRNPGKLRELRELLAPLGVRVMSPDEAGWNDAVVEDGDTLEANALKKARAAWSATGTSAVADDTGLFVDSLGGAPGVHSARYAGPAQDPVANCAKLLDSLSGVPIGARGAEFRCAVALVGENESRVFTGSVRGRIATAPQGEWGFGYDPVFLVPDLGLTFAELPPEEKNRRSHRGKALASLRAYLAAEKSGKGHA
jgi:XTP/dITP diphosphohydrolase